MSVGISFAEAENYTLPQYLAMCRHWRKCPPTHKLIAAYIGYKPPVEIKDADYAAVAAETDDWFKDPERFFK